MQKKFLIGVAVILVIFLAGGYFYYQIRIENPRSDKSIEQKLVDSNPGLTIEETPIVNTAIAPNIYRGIQYPVSINLDTRARFEEKLSIVVASLEQNPTNRKEWLNLGVLYHAAEDYEGAREVWEFLIKDIPTHPTPYDNLGKMYYYSLRDYQKAESYFLQSIAISPDRLTPYLELHELYKHSYKTETNLAVDILRDALEKFPNNTDLFVLLGGYYRDMKQYDLAKKEFTTALAKAEAEGDTARILAINEEIARLPVAAQLAP